MSDTPRTDALCTHIYNQSTAYEVADARFGYGHNWTEDEAYSAAIDLARTLERELTRKQLAIKVALEANNIQREKLAERDAEVAELKEALRMYAATKARKWEPKEPQ